MARCWWVALCCIVICRFYPADLPVWLPWEFSWSRISGHRAHLHLVRARAEGVATRPKHPPLWRLICFVVGVASFYIVLQTRIDYYAQHMFFVHRWAHFVLHHAGAFLIALGMCGAGAVGGDAGFPQARDQIAAGAGDAELFSSIR